MGKFPSFLKNAGKRFKDASKILSIGKKNVHIFMPSYPGPKPASVNCLMDLVSNFSQIGLGYNTVLQLSTGAVISQLRSDAHRSLIEDENAIGILHVDSDMRWPNSDGRTAEGQGVIGFNALHRLLAKEKDIIGGLYVTRTMPVQANAGWFNGDGTMRRLTDLALIDPRNGETFEVDWIGFGFVYISRRAVVKVAELSERYDYTCEHETRLFDMPEKMMRLRNLLDAHREGGIDREQVIDGMKRLLRSSANYHEDVSFCKRAREAGVRIYCDPSFELQHYGEYPYSRLDWVGLEMARQQHEAEAAGG